jgi:hypothetical protein
MCIEGTNAKADGELVVLISKLLELVDATLPEGTELDFRTAAVDDSICLAVW